MLIMKRISFVSGTFFAVAIGVWVGALAIGWCCEHLSLWQFMCLALSPAALVTVLILWDLATEFFPTPDATEKGSPK